MWRRRQYDKWKSRPFREIWLWDTMLIHLVRISGFFGHFLRCVWVWVLGESRFRGEWWVCWLLIRLEVSLDGWFRMWVCSGDGFFEVDGVSFRVGSFVCFWWEKYFFIYKKLCSKIYIIFFCWNWNRALSNYEKKWGIFVCNFYKHRIIYFCFFVAFEIRICTNLLGKITKMENSSILIKSELI